jgi:hypothetical protein
VQHNIAASTPKTELHDVVDGTVAKKIR